MEPQPTSLSAVVRSDIIHVDGVTKFSPNRRFATLFSEGSPSDTIFFLETGLVKIYKRGPDGKEIILQILGANEIFGEQALGSGATPLVSAEVLLEGIIHVIPRDLFVSYCDQRQELWKQVAELLTSRKRELEKKIELLCLRDVEYRILYYLAELAVSFGSKIDDREYAIPLSQGALASLIGATRETTSTTLNALARRGLLRLGRRQLIVPSLDVVLTAVNDHGSRAARA